MKVLLAQAPGELRVVEMETPRPGPHEILAKVAYCGVCGTDISIYKGLLNLGEDINPIYPVRLGHEWSGVVVETGSGTQRLKVGSRIISDTGYSCGECEMCLEGRYQCCLNGRAIGTTGECWPGAFAEYMLMTERLSFEVPDNVGLDEAALVEPASIGLYGLVRAGVGPNKNLLVIGTGPIGLGGMACAKGMGVGKTILAGRKDKKLEIGAKMGAHILVNTTREDLMQVVMRETKGRGMDIVMDTSGDASIFNDVLEMVSPGGMLVIPAFYEKPIPNAHLDRIIARDCTLIGAAGTPNMGRKVLDMLQYGRTSLKEMITDRFAFADVEAAFHAVTERNDSRVKIIVKM